MKERGSSVGISDEPAGNNGGGVSILDVPAHEVEVTTKLDAMREQLQKLRQQQDELERQKGDLEDLRRKQDEYARGKAEMIDNLTRALVTLEREELQAQRRDLFDAPVNPLSELDDTPVVLPVAQPELFTATNAGGKLGQYLASANLRPPKPQLRRVQNENRHRFYLWLGLSCVAVWLIYAVVR